MGYDNRITNQFKKPMQQNTTFNDLLLFAFNETQLADTVRIANELESNPDVHYHYSELLDTLKGVREAVLSPSDKVTQAILAYAAK